MQLWLYETMDKAFVFKTEKVQSVGGLKEKIVELLDHSFGVITERTPCVEEYILPWGTVIGIILLIMIFMMLRRKLKKKGEKGHGQEKDRNETERS